MAEPRAAQAAQFWLVAGAALVALVVWGSLTPSPPHIEMPFPQFNKLEHFGAYLLMTAWFTAAFPRRWLWIALVFVALGGLIEILQNYTGRDAEWLDWAADCAGTAVALGYPARWLTRFRSSIMERHVHAH